MCIQEPELKQSETEAHSVTILVVEDQAPVLKVVERSLIRSGMKVLAASNADEGLALLRQHIDQVDLLLTDVVMPRMSGPELALRAREVAPQLKVIFMSGYSGDTVSSQLDGMAPFAMVEKPFRPAELVSAVRKMLDQE